MTRDRDVVKRGQFFLLQCTLPLLSRSIVAPPALLKSPADEHRASQESKSRTLAYSIGLLGDFSSVNVTELSGPCARGRGSLCGRAPEAGRSLRR